MMRSTSRIRLLLSYNRRTISLFIEAVLCLAWARLLLILMPFSRFAPRLGDRSCETPFHAPSPADAVMIKHIASAINITSRHTWWDSRCLVRAAAAMKMLARRQIASTLYLGTARDRHGKLQAHAWLRSGPYFVTGDDVMHQFVVVEKFAKRVNPPRRSSP